MKQGYLIYNFSISNINNIVYYITCGQKLEWGKLQNFLIQGICIDPRPDYLSSFSMRFNRMHKIFIY